MLLSQPKIPVRTMTGSPVRTKLKQLFALLLRKVCELTREKSS
jgi:hypothetical protein